MKYYIALQRAANSNSGVFESDERACIWQTSIARNRLTDMEGMLERERRAKGVNGGCTTPSSHGYHSHEIRCDCR